LREQQIGERSGIRDERQRKESGGNDRRGEERRGIANKGEERRDSSKPS
jgi:hypothetical protein